MSGERGTDEVEDSVSMEVEGSEVSLFVRERPEGPDGVSEVVVDPAPESFVSAIAACINRLKLLS